MHPTAMNSCRLFFEAYAKSFDNNTQIVEVGSQDVNGGLREIAPPNLKYIGVDFTEGKGVDIVLDSPYKLPFDDNSVDMVISSSCFEHSEMFWVVFMEIMRILKPHGLFYLNAPSNGPVHRYPVDCWRLYPDAGNALTSWAKYNNINAELMESYISNQCGGLWNDFVAVFLKDSSYKDKYPNRILDVYREFTNGIKNGVGFINENFTPEDLRK